MFLEDVFGVKNKNTSIYTLGSHVWRRMRKISRHAIAFQNFIDLQNGDGKYFFM